MKLNMRPTFKQLLIAEKVNSEKNKEYYRWYNVKITRASHKQEITKQKIYKNILSGQSGVNFNPWIRFETSFIIRKKAKALTKSNQPEKSNPNPYKRFRCSFIKHVQINSVASPVGIATRQGKTALCMRPSQAESKSVEEETSEEEEGNCLVIEAFGED